MPDPGPWGDHHGVGHAKVGANEEVVAVISPAVDSHDEWQ